MSMRTFRMKALLPLVALLVLLLALAGCGGNSGGAGSGQAGGAAGASQPANAAGGAPGNEEPGPKQPADYSGKVTIWGWGDANNMNKYIEAFNKTYPNVEVSYLQTADYLKKLQVAVAANTELPDIVFLQRNDRGHIINMNILENLDAPPYNFNRADVFEGDLAEMTDAEGHVVAIPYDMSISGLAYRRDMAREFLGTDDPEELESMFRTWEDFIAKGKEVYQRSGGKKYMFASVIDLKDIFFNQNPKPFVVDNKLQVKEVLLPAFELMQKFRDNHVVDDMKGWSPAWMASFAQGNHIFYVCPLWFPKYVLEPNDPEGKGRWGLMVPVEGGFVNGGTAWGISKQSKNKEAAWEFLKFVLLSREGAELSKEVDGFFTHYKPSYDNDDYYNYKDPMFGDQEIGKKFFVDVQNRLVVKQISPYDSLVHSITDTLLDAIVADRNMTAQDLADEFVKEFRSKAPEVEIE